LIKIYREEKYLSSAERKLTKSFLSAGDIQMKKAFVLFEKRAEIMSPELDRPIAVITARTIEEAVGFLGIDSVTHRAILNPDGDEARVIFNFDGLLNSKRWEKICEDDSITFKMLDRSGRPLSPPLEIP